MSRRAVIITGAGSPIGAACARRFADAGDRLVLADPNEEAGRALFDELTGKGAEAVFVAADPADKLAVHNILAEALENFGRLDVLAHGGFAADQGSFLELSEEEFDRVISANLRALFIANQAAARQFLKQIENETSTDFPGAIVNILTDDAGTARAERPAAAASQGGAAQLMKSMALSLAPHGIRVNAVAAGAMKGAVSAEVDPKALRAAVPMARLGDAGEAAEAAFFLASPAASFITGRILFVAGGRAVAAPKVAAEKNILSRIVDVVFKNPPDVEILRTRCVFRVGGGVRGGRRRLFGGL